jgi:hypothetical protein
VTADTARRARKNAGEECFRASCGSLGPRYGITWKCPAGHRETFWYCRDCIGHMTELAFRPPDGTGRPVCPACKVVLMVPAAEQILR